MLVICLSMTAVAQFPADSAKHISVAALHEDLIVLKNVLETVHPGLYRFTSKSDLDKLFVGTKNAIRKPLDEIAFYRLVNPIITSIRDEHTFALPSEEWWKSELGQSNYGNNVPVAKGRFFPFFVKLIRDRIFIDNNLSDSLSIKDGDEIISINDRPAKEILDLLLPTISTNGNIQTFPRRHLEQFSLNQTYNRFIVHYAIFIGTPIKFNLQLKDRHGKNLRYMVDALPSHVIFNNYWRRYSTVNDSKKRRENPLDFRQIGPKSSYLGLSSFHTQVWSRYNYSFSTEFRNIFNYLEEAHIENLVIDLRGNEGGNANIAIGLLQYLCTAAYQPYHHHIVNNYRFPGLMKYFRDSSAITKFPDENFSRQSDGTFKSNPVYPTETWSRPMQPAASRFKGRLFILTDGATGSAAAILATMIRVNRKDAIFIGEECGGVMDGPVSGGGTDILLPNSGLRIDIPFIRRVINLNGYPTKKDHGVLPDHPVDFSVGDLYDKNDPALKTAMDQIKKG